MVTDVDGMVCVNPGKPSAMLSTTRSKIIPATSLMREGIRGRKLPRGSDELGNLELSEHGAGRRIVCRYRRGSNRVRWLALEIKATGTFGVTLAVKTLVTVVGLHRFVR